jgi:hypothetical protein
MALLPPSSSSERPKRCATRGPTMRPMRVLPVAETSGTRRVVEHRAADGEVGADARGRPARPFLAEHLGAIFVIAIAHSGVFSDGFHSALSPQTSASIAFHAHTAIGKLKAVITMPTVPSGCQVSRMWWFGRSLAIVRP